jgi:hypothetical protein
MNKIFLFFVSIFLFLTGFLMTNADTATLNNPDNNCKFYTELFNILSKSGSASEKLNAKIQMDKYCNLKPSLLPISSNTSNVTQNTLGNTSIRSNVRNCPLVESISCPKGYIRRAVFNEGCLTRYFCQKINQITPSQNPAFFNEFGKNRCPATALKPYNCPEKNLVPILKNGCIVQYFCNKSSTDCPAINWDFANCPASQKIYTKDNQGCFRVTCR